MQRLRGDWEARTGAQPTREEEERIRREWLEEEVLYREARELGLAERDTVVRRRLVQRMRFLIEDTAEIAEPDDRQLQVWIDTHPDRYTGSPEITFEQRFFSRGRRGLRAREDAVAAVERLTETPDAEIQSDPFPRGSGPRQARLEAIQRDFGIDFAEGVGALEPGRWTGPIESSYGFHVVRVIDHRDTEVPTLDDVRERAREDWMYAQRQDANRKAIDALIARYGERSEVP